MMVFGGFTDKNLIQSFGLLFTGNYKYALAVIFITKLTMLISELFWDPEVETKLPDDVFFKPYPRIFVQQFMVILGGGFAMFSKSVMGYLVVLVLCKTILDLAISNIGKERFEKMLVQNKSKSLKE
jgi:hypothetical protein